ncbi:hypothetical protein ACIBSV_09000 [Embleya sp. NPDC050154]|uniref:hypothetical protein n=1 Tax=unclassified Embleya TaxID=2699296 RepID=UPI003793144C
MTGAPRRAGAALIAVLVLGTALNACGGSDDSGGGPVPAGTRVAPTGAPTDPAAILAEAEQAADRADRDADAPETPPG